MTDIQFYTIFSAALKSQNRDAFISDWALSGIWDDDLDANVPNERINEIERIWDVAHMTIFDIRQRTGLSQAKFATRFCIPCRSVENWESGTFACPAYLRLLLAQATGVYKRRYGRAK